MRDFEPFFKKLYWINEEIISNFTVNTKYSITIFIVMQERVYRKLNLDNLSRLVSLKFDNLL